MDPITLAYLAVLALIWSIVGAAGDHHLRDIPKPQLASVLIVVFGGPIVWVFSLFRGLSALRARALSHYGVGGYSCCGSGCNHRQKGRS